MNSSRPSAATIAAAALLPPLGIFWDRGPGRDFLITCGLTMAGFLPGAGFALIRVLAPRPTPAASA